MTVLRLTQDELAKHVSIRSFDSLMADINEGGVKFSREKKGSKSIILMHEIHGQYFLQEVATPTTRSEAGLPCMPSMLSSTTSCLISPIIHIPTVLYDLPYLAVRYEERG